MTESRSQSSKKSTVKMWIKRGILAVGGVFVFGLTVEIISTIQVFGFPRFSAEVIEPRPNPPVPNALEDYLAAARAMKEVDRRDKRSGHLLDSWQPETPLSYQKEVVQANASALRHLREGFKHDYQAPPAAPLVVNGFLNLAQFRSLARLFVTDGLVKEKTGDLAGAIQSYLDAVRLGDDLPHGGLIIDMQVGLACKRIGQKRIWPLVGRLDEPSTQAAASRLEEITAHHQSFSETLREEKRFVQMGKALPNLSAKEIEDRYPPITDKTPISNRPDPPVPQMFLTRWMQQGYVRYLDQAIREMRQPFNERSASLVPPRHILVKIQASFIERGWFQERKGYTEDHLLAVAFALHAFHQKNGHYPSTLEELTPLYLKQIPKDPFNPREEIRYHLKNGSILLYSVGPDGKNDQGTPIQPPIVPPGKPSAGREVVKPYSKGDIVAGVDFF